MSRQQKGGGRRERVAEAMKSELSELIAREVKDPRVKAAMPAIGHIDVNRDLNVATVRVSFLIDDAKVIGAAMTGLEAAAGFLRGPLARRLNLPHAPELRFFHDTSQEMGMRISNIVRDDEAKRREAEAAAGEEEGEPGTGTGTGTGPTPSGSAGTGTGPTPSGSAGSDG
jgi:ribosome-binding factor A